MYYIWDNRFEVGLLSGRSEEEDVKKQLIAKYVLKTILLKSNLT